LARHAYPLCLSLPAVPRDLHSFPTRRSSDLNPVLRMRRRLVHGCRAINVMVPRKLAALPNAVLMRGNHELTIGGSPCPPAGHETDRKSTRLNSSHGSISYAVFCLKKKTRTKS